MAEYSDDAVLSGDDPQVLDCCCFQLILSCRSKDDESKRLLPCNEETDVTPFDKKGQIAECNGFQFGNDAKVNLSSCVVNVSAAAPGSSWKPNPKFPVHGMSPSESSSHVIRKLEQLGMDMDRLYDSTIIFRWAGKQKRVNQKNLNNCCVLDFPRKSANNFRKEKKFLMNEKHVSVVACKRVNILRGVAVLKFPILSDLSVAVWIDMKSLDMFAIKFDGNMVTCVMPPGGSSMSGQEPEGQVLDIGSTTQVLSLENYLDWFERSCRDFRCYRPMKGATLYIGDPKMHDAKFEISPYILEFLSEKLGSLYRNVSA